QVVEDHDARRAAETAKGLLVQLGPRARAGAPREQPDRLAAAARRQHEEPRAAVLATLRVAHHRPLAVVDLTLFAGRREDARVRLRRGRALGLAHEAPDAGVARGEAMVVDQVLPD